MRVIVELIVNVLWLAILGRVLLTWFPEVNRNNPIVVIIYQISVSYTHLTLPTILLV